MTLSPTPMRRPADWKLLVAACLLQVGLIVLPLPRFGPAGAFVAVVAVLSVAALLGSLSTAVLYLCFVSAVIPSTVLEKTLRLPGNVDFVEALFALIAVLCALSFIAEGRARRTRTPLDRPVAVFLGLVVLSCPLGLLYGQSVSQMLRDVRYPIYYGLYFVAVEALDERHVARFLGVLMLSAGLVGARYVVEFLSMVNLSIAGQFFRVAYIEGLMLPVGVLAAAAIYMFWEGRFLRVLSGVCLLPAGLGLMLTVGRAFWISMAAGLLAMAAIGLLRRRRTGSQRLAPVVLVPAVVLALTFGFQRLTDTGIGAHAVERLSGLQAPGSDQSISGRFVSYGIAASKWLERPLLGHGHGAVVTFPSLDDYGPIELTVGGVDSLYLTLALRMGAVGTLAFAWVFARALRLAWRACRESEWTARHAFCAAFVTVYVALLIYSAADATLIHNRLIFLHATALALVGRTCAAGDGQVPAGA